jgi:beta-lactamase class A
MQRRVFLASVPGVVLFAASARAATAEPALADYERATGGRVGLYAENLRTGARIAWRADQRFVMCSTFKMSLAAGILARVDRGQDRLDAEIAFGPADIMEYAPVAKANLVRGRMTVAEHCEAAVSVSDNTCANLLLARLGGPPALTAFWRRVGDAVSRLDHDEPMLNRSPPGDPHDTTTPRAMAATLRRVILGDVLAPASRERLTAWMVGGKTGGNRLRAGLPAGWRIGDKTGNNGKDAAGDLAVAWPRPDTPIAISAYVQGGAPTPEQIEGVFTQIGRMVASQLA